MVLVIEEEKKRKINPRTGQISTDTTVQQNTNATQDFNPSKIRTDDERKKAKEKRLDEIDAISPKLVADKQEAIRQGLRVEGQTFTPEMGGSVQNTQNEQQAKIDSQEALPTEETQLVQPFFSDEGQAQLYEEIQKRAGTRGTPTIKQGFEQEGLKGAFKAAFGISKELFHGTILGLDYGVEFVGGNVPIIGDLIDSATGNNKKTVANLKSSIAQMSPQIENMVTAAKAGYPKESALGDLKALENNINSTEERIQQEAVSSASVRSSGDIIDIQAQLLKVRQDIILARNTINLLP